MAKKDQNRGVDSSDIEIGRRIRTHRLLSDMSQNELAERLGITFQQIQKYEIGANRITAKRLSQIADVFDLPVDQLVDSKSKSKSTRLEACLEFLDTGDAVRLVKAFSQIEDRQIRRSIVELTEKIARNHNNRTRAGQRCL